MNMQDMNDINCIHVFFDDGWRINKRIYVKLEKYHSVLLL